MVGAGEAGDDARADELKERDDPEAPWNRDPAEGLPDVIQPGRIAMELWNFDANGEPVAYDFIFHWDGGTKADWYYDIGTSNSGLSAMSSAPIGGTATWNDHTDVEFTVCSDDFDLDEVMVLEGAAPQAIHEPRTWVNLAIAISGIADGFLEETF